MRLQYEYVSEFKVKVETALGYETVAERKKSEMKLLVRLSL
jgi:hypothetical protein